MAKTDKTNKTYDEDKPKGRVAAIIFLLIMLLSTVGFAMLIGGGGGSSNNNGDLPTEVPMGELFQNSNTGELYLGTVRNGEQFIFVNYNETTYENNNKLIELAERIKIAKRMDIYVDKSFNSSESQFLISKALTGLKTPSDLTINNACNGETLILTQNEITDKNCLVFNPKIGEEYLDTEILIYNILK